MVRYVMTFAMLLISLFTTEAAAYNIVVVDSATHIPLPGASVLEKNGEPIGISNNRGVLRGVAKSSYPILVRYLGFNDKIVMEESTDTVFLSELVSELPEVVIESRGRRVLHILAYVREYSSLATYTDTVFLFREKMVDYMLPTDDKSKFKGWSTPRTLTCKSYFRFTDDNGLDSVSDVSHYHFSWSDWMGMPPEESLPAALRNGGVSADTLKGRYSPAEIWSRAEDRVNVCVDVLADKGSRKWVPAFVGFFGRNLDFERFKVSYSYDNIDGDNLSLLNLYRYSIDIESRGRGREMFHFNRVDQPFFVTTHADIYILDKEFITVKEGRKWEKREFDTEETGIYEPMEAPDLSQSTLDLISRVNLLDKDKVRLDFQPDARLISHHDSRKNFKIGRRALFLLKQLTGISKSNFDKNQKKNWNTFRKNNQRKEQK